MRPEPADLELVGAAVTALRRGAYVSAAAVRTSAGRVVAAVGLGAGCPEPAAIGAALALGDRVVTIAAVRHVDADTTRVTAPCSACRGLLAAHAPHARVVHLADRLAVTPLDGLPQG